ncbi:MAG: NF038130 family PEP-CTERM protein [Chthoniobacterales bacterium]
MKNLFTSLIVLLTLCFTGSLFAQSMLTAVLSGTDTITYVESSPGLLTVDNMANLMDVLQGSATAAGGNVELFFSSDNSTYDDPNGAFKNVTPTGLTTNFGASGDRSIRSLNGNDWFMTSLGAYETTYGSDNFANIWYGDLLNAMDTQSGGLFSFAQAFAGITNEDLYNSFLGNGGFPQLSDPNISYVEIDGLETVVGLAGFLNGNGRLAALTGMSKANIDALFPSGVQFSEVAIVDGTAIYGFSAVPSGVNLNDQPPAGPDAEDSYTGTYELRAPAPIPEPTAGILFLTTVLLFSFRRYSKLA